MSVAHALHPMRILCAWYTYGAGIRIPASACALASSSLVDAGIWFQTFNVGCRWSGTFMVQGLHSPRDRHGMHMVEMLQPQQAVNVEL